MSYDSLLTPELLRLAQAHLNKSLLQKNKPFSKALISSELDRLVTLFRKNGFFKFTRENLYAEVDTTNVALLELTLDPFEQARKIAEAETQRRNNPTINVYIKQRPTEDSTTTEQFKIGRFFYYPETLINEIPNSLMRQKFPFETRQGNVLLKQTYRTLKSDPLPNIPT